MKSRNRYGGRRAWGRRVRGPVVWLLALALADAGGVALSAQERAGAGVARPLSLESALRLAEAASEQVEIARAGLTRSSGERRRARSELFPQVFASFSYTRTLDSEFRAFGGGGSDTASAGGESCGTFTPNPALPLAQRVDSLEAAVRCQSDENPFAAFADLPFGRENQWRFDVSVSQTVFSGGRVQAQGRVAAAGRRLAELSLTTARAQLMLDVAGAYYDAALAARLYRIAESTLRQAETTLDQVRLARQVGEQPEFELLRAQVTRDTQEPQVIQRRSTRDLALLRLRQLLNLPEETELELTTPLDGSDAGGVVLLVRDVLGLPADTAVDVRAAVREAMEALRIQEARSAIVRAQRLPSLSLAMQYGRVGYPDAFSPADAVFRTNWSVSASVQLPVFTGGRLSGEALIARADEAEARARLELTRELAALDTRDAVERLAAAEAAWRASGGTVGQAERAYVIAEVRYREGISTQLELNDSRILLQLAQANGAQAARDLQLARLRVALLPYLRPGGAGPASTLPASSPVPSPAAGAAGAPAQAGVRSGTEFRDR